MPGATLDSLTTFGALLKHLRRRARLTLRELGIAVGYSEAHMARLESGQRLPDISSVRARFVPALGLEREVLLADRLVALAEAAHRAESPSAPGDNVEAVSAPETQAQPHTQSSSTVNNLPHAITSFVGREQELATVTELLTATRLLTLTGGGGIGKTRLAVQAAQQRLNTYADGVWLVELETVNAPTLVADAVASACGLTVRNRPALDALLDYLGGKNVLVLLDNCEHLIGACASLAQALLSACPQVHILATSREALNIPGEVAWQVPPLDTHEAVQIFVERARATRPGFAMNEQNAQTVLLICERLDGIPLAIELAASRLKALSVEQIAERLNDRFALLSGGARTALPRHQTLRTLVDWSYDLLSDAEHALLQRLSVFSGGWTLELAETACADDAPSGSILDESASACPMLRRDQILPLLFELVSKSLVQVDERSDDTRYRFSETMREYAQAKLEQCGGLDAAQRKHALTFAALAEQAEPHMRTRAQQRWVGLLARELDNLRAALAWSLSPTGDVVIGIRLAGALWQFWIWTELVNEGRRWSAALIAAMPPDAPPALRLRALLGACALVSIDNEQRMPEEQAVREWAAESLRLAQLLNDTTGLVLALCHQALLQWNENDLSGAQALMEQSLRLARQCGNLSLAIWPLDILVSLMIWQQDWVRAVAWLEDELAAARKVENLQIVAVAMVRLGIVALRQRDYARAIALTEYGLHMAREVGYRHIETQALMQIGEAARYSGNLPLAAARFEELYSNGLTRDDGFGVGFALQLLAKVACAEGDYPRANDLYTRSLALRERMGSWSVAYNLEGLAYVAAAQGQHERAMCMLGAAQTLRQINHWALWSDNVPEYQRCLEALRRQLDGAAFARAWAAGRAMSAEEAVAYALQSTEVRLHAQA